MDQQPSKSDNQEIDLSQVFKGVNDLIEKFAFNIFKILKFVKDNLVYFIVLIIGGFLLGKYVNPSKNLSSNEIIITPNYGSVELVYGKIEQLNNVIASNDTVFLKKNGFSTKYLPNSITIEPINNIYSFVDENPESYKYNIVRTLIEKGEIVKLMTDFNTPMLYENQKIVYTSKKGVINNSFQKELHDFLNADVYLKSLKDQSLENIKFEIEQNYNLSKNVDSLLNQMHNSKLKSNSNLVYMNENTGLGDLIDKRMYLSIKINKLKMDLLKKNEVVKFIGSSTNTQLKTGVLGNKSLIYPLVFIFLFIFFKAIVGFYKKYNAKTSF